MRELIAAEVFAAASGLLDCFAGQAARQRLSA